MIGGSGSGRERCKPCSGRGDVDCKRCEKGKVNCKECKGAKRLYSRCETCRGKQEISCITCEGVGQVAPAKMSEQASKALGLIAEGLQTAEETITAAETKWTTLESEYEALEKELDTKRGALSHLLEPVAN